MMEAMVEDKKEMIQAAKKVFILTLFAFLMGNCASTNVKEEADKENHTVEKYNTEDQASYLNINFYHKENKSEPIPAVYQINGIIFGPKDNSDDYIVSVRPGKYAIRAGFIGKEWAEISVRVSKADSVVVKMFLKDDPEPLDN